jgi:hypothetical protein
MKASKLAEFLNKNPNADVMLMPGPIPFEPTHITFNNEANAYIVQPPPPAGQNQKTPLPPVSQQKPAPPSYGAKRHS